MRLLLSARLAARRLLHRRWSARTPRTAWRPVVLRWRHRWMRHSGEPGRRPGVPILNLWRMELHLHFGLHPVERPRHVSRRVATSPALGRHARRLDLTPAKAIARAGSPGPALGAASRGSSTAQEGVLAVPALAHERGVTALPRVRPAASVDSPPARSREAGRAGGPRTVGHLARAPQRDTRSITGRRLVLASEMLMRHRRLVTSIGGTAAPRGSSAVSPVRWGRLPDLVWSEPRRAVADATAKTPRTTVAASVARSSGGPASARESTSEPQAPAARVTATPITTLDPALVDRLADDVIRRVERRVRIERERRGI
jgi:hypothetical protein